MQCLRCGKSFAHSSSLSRHQRESCPVIGGEGSQQVEVTKKRVECDKDMATTSSHVKRRRLDQTSLKIRDGIEKLNSAFKCRICSYRFSAITHLIDPNSFFDSIRDDVCLVLVHYLEQFTTIKVNCELFSMYSKPDTEVSDTKSFYTENKVVTVADNVDDVFDDFREEILAKTEDFQQRDSGKL